MSRWLDMARRARAAAGTGDKFDRSNNSGLPRSTNALVPTDTARAIATFPTDPPPVGRPAPGNVETVSPETDSLDNHKSLKRKPDRDWSNSANSSLPCPDHDAFAERAAILEHDGALPRADAEIRAAAEQGYPDASAMHTAAAAAYEAKLAALHQRETSPKGRRCLAAGLRFFRAGWATRALAAGWSPLSLFGYCPHGRWERVDRLGAAWLEFEVAAVSAETIRFLPGLVLRHGRQADGAVLPWEPVEKVRFQEDFGKNGSR